MRFKSGVVAFICFGLMFLLVSWKIASGAVNLRLAPRYRPSISILHTSISPQQHVPDRGSSHDAPDDLETFPIKGDDPNGPLTVPQACASAISDVIRAGYRTKWCHLLIVNAAFVPLLDNWLCRAQEIGMFDLLQSTVFVSTEPSVLSMLQTRKLKHVAQSSLHRITSS